MANITFAPQPGRQTEFISCEADIAIYGGAAGGGKTFGLLIDPLRYCGKYGGLNCVIFRRNAVDLNIPGGLWPSSSILYNYSGAHPNNAEKKWIFKEIDEFGSHSVIKFAGLQYEQDVYSWQGGQFDFIGFDELTHFSSYQFWYLVGRLRSTTGILKPYCRATCNPSAGWVSDLLAWWIGQDGFYRPERAGKIRYLIRLEEENYWYDSEEEAFSAITEWNLTDMRPLSFTFIPATINDNPILLKNNPNYYATLAALPAKEKRQMLEGNWKIMPVGKIFNVSDFNLFAVDPADPDCILVTIDTAHELKTSNDFTVIQIWYRANGKIYLINQIRGKFDYGTQEQMAISVCHQYSPTYVGIEKKGNGHALLQEIPKKCSIPLIAIERNKDKYSRGYQAEPYIASGYVYLKVDSDYYTDFISEISNFSPESPSQIKGQKIHDDQVDAMMDAIYLLLHNKIKGTTRETNSEEYSHITLNRSPTLSSFSQQLEGKPDIFNNSSQTGRLFE